MSDDLLGGAIRELVNELLARTGMRLPDARPVTEYDVRLALTILRSRPGETVGQHVARRAAEQRAKAEELPEHLRVQMRAIEDAVRAEVGKILVLGPNGHAFIDSGTP